MLQTKQKTLYEDIYWVTRKTLLKVEKHFFFMDFINKSRINNFYFKYGQEMVNRLPLTVLNFSQW